MPKISIITPTYNRSKFIRRTIKSVIDQTYTDWEFLIIDDSSTDNTVELVNEFVKQDPRIKLFKTPQNSGGPALPKNIGIENATGEYVAFLDDDDEWLPEKLSKQLELFESSNNSKLGLVSCFINIRDNNGKLISKHKKNYRGDVIKNLARDCFVMTSSCVMTKLDILKKVGLFDTRFKISDDWDMWLKISKEGYQFDFTPEYLVNYILHGKNIYLGNNNGSIKNERDSIILCEKNEDVFKKNNFKILGYYYFYKKNYILSIKYNILNILSMKSGFEQKIKSFSFIILSFLPNLENSFRKIFFKIKKIIDYIKIILFKIGLYNKKELPKYRYNKKIYLKNYKNFGFKHRSGWPYVMSLLNCLSIRNGILFDSFIEIKFGWSNNLNKISAYKEPWVGIFHVPDNIPEWFNEKQTPREIFKNKYFIESLKNCKGLYCLSNYEKNILKKYTNLPINVVLHPTETPNIKFSIEKFINNKDKEIIQLGTFCRKLSSIFLLPVIKIKKSALGMNKYGFYILKQEEMKLNIKVDIDSVKIYKFLNNKKYDETLSQNIAFIDLYETSANNAVIECIVRNTPLLINPHPAVIEYLGSDYPFYFNSLEEAAQKAENMDLIKKTHEYLLNLKTKEKLTGDAFINAIINSSIYKSL